MRSLLRRLRLSTAPLVGLVRPTGWAVLVLSVGCLVAGRRLGWTELDVIAAAGLVALALCALFLIGRLNVEVSLSLSPQRLSAGDPPVTGDLRVTNPAGRPLLPFEVELPVGARSHRFGFPVLSPHGSHLETFVVPAHRRAVIPVGPARTRRGDPLGLFNRTVPWTGVTEIFVRPRSLPLESLGGGLLRDLEGVETQDVSQSDLAFHALREYVPGDDLRHVHWLSSAKSQTLMVRQYLDTRRSHVTIVVDDLASSYADAEDFETALSVAATVAKRSFLDEFEVSFVCGEHAVDGGATRVLDAMCRADFGRTGVVEATLRASRLAGGTSLLIIVSGSGLEFRAAQRAAAAFGPEVRRLGVRVDPAATASVSETGDLPLASLPRLESLPSLLRWSVR